MFFQLLPFGAAIFSVVLALTSVLVRKKPAAVTWCFSSGMAVLAIDSLLVGFSLRAAELAQDPVPAAALSLIVKSFVPAAWLGFSVLYSRGDFREFLQRWRIPLTVVSILPIGLALIARQRLLVIAEASGADLYVRLTFLGKLLNVTILIALVWVLLNIEQTFRSAAGTLRWRIKYVVLGVAVIIGARLYVHSQAILFSTYDSRWAGIEAGGLLTGCVFLVLAWLRAAFQEFQIYPSRAVLRSSLTVLIAGGYLFTVGILAHVVERFGGANSLQFQALVVLLGMAGLAVLLLSERLRQRVHNFVGRHFFKAQHDSVRIWTEFSRRLAKVRDQAGVCAVSATLISETFKVMSVTIWLLDEQKDQLSVGASTTMPDGGRGSNSPPVAAFGTSTELQLRPEPFDLDIVDEPWADRLRQLNSTTFSNGGHRWCVPLLAGEQTLGAFVLSDRVNGTDYTVEHLHLLQCISHHVTSVLLNLRLANELATARELEAFRTMSAFFVHDLKNAAASLNLTLTNLPVHFDDPVFREDAFRAIRNTAARIDDLIGRLTALRQRPEIRPVEADLNQLVNEALERLNAMPSVELTKELRPLPRMLADPEQVRSVVANLVLNAGDATGPGGHICIGTEHVGGNVVLSVSDNGCGMTPGFVRESLFRPFQSTKKRGIGIGMFQSRMIVEAHGGEIRVETEAGKGSTFRVSLPVKGVA